MKKLFILIIFILCVMQSRSPALAEIKLDNLAVPIKMDLPMASATLSPVQPQAIDFRICNKFFKVNAQKLFYLTLASVNANRFKINEFQSKSGYIVFSVAKWTFLATVVNIDSKNSMLKITPCDNVYFFPIGIIQNMFKYIELNIKTDAQVQKIQKFS